MMDPTREEMLELARERFPGVDEFEVEEAIYVFASEYHGGQWSALYEALCRSPFCPGMSWSGVGGLSPEGEEMYNALVEEFAS